MTAMETVMSSILVSVSAITMGSGKPPRLSVEVVVVAAVGPSSGGLQHVVGRGLRLAGQGLGMVVLQPVLVAADALLHLGDGRVEGQVRVAAQALGGELLARRQRDRAVDPEGMALAADHHVGAAAVAVEVFADAGGDFVGDPRTQGLADVDVFAGDLDLHVKINAPEPGRCQSTAV